MIYMNWGVDSLNEVVTLTMWDLRHPLAGIHGIFDEESLRDMLLKGELALSELKDIKKARVEENQKITNEFLNNLGIKVSEDGI